MGPNSLLTGVRVVELAQYLPAPYGTQILADLGAEVIKIEPPGGDPMRHLDQEGDGDSPIYQAINAGKVVTRLDLKSDDGLGQAKQLISRADILVESFRPGTMDRLGLGHAALIEDNPRLVHVALSGWGQTGPYAMRAGHDINYGAIAGSFAASGTEERPVAPFPPMADMASGMMVAIAALAGIHKAGQSGQGGFYDLSIMETMLAWQSFGLAEAVAGNPVKRGAGLLSGGAACYQFYQCADGAWLSVGALEEKFWARFCEALERTDLIQRQFERPLPQTGLVAEVASIIATQNRDEWMAVFQDIDCCVEPVLGWDEITEHQHVRKRGLVADGQVLSGLKLDGKGPQTRQPVRELTSQAALMLWD
ncbi:MAG: CoA transferase [Alphaproteobacteria bacterium]|nr:CoA transferase [Alphaproteobacteria bacterium SS10]